MSDLRVAVIGAGIIGLSAAYHLLKEGAHVTIVDRDPEGDKASFGNAGGIAVTEVFPASSPGVWRRVPGWLLDPLGPLTIRPQHLPRFLPWLVRFAQAGTPREIDRISQALAALNARTYGELLPMLAETGLSGELNRRGALSVYETEAGFKRDTAEWQCKRARGIVIEDLHGDQARELEPALGPGIRRAVFTREWSNINDPKRLVDGLRHWLQRTGVSIVRADVCNLVTHSPASVALEVRNGNSILADRVLVAAGVWSEVLARRVGDRVLLESERGYNMTLPRPGISLQREVIFAEHKFVAVPLSCGLRIGGAAEFAGLGAPANHRRSQVLLELAGRYLPGLQSADGNSWMGHRSTTPDSLPVIGPSELQPRIFYAFGHGHLGLTQAATTGRLISDMMFGKPATMDVEPYGIRRFR